MDASPTPVATPTTVSRLEGGGAHCFQPNCPGPGLGHVSNWGPPPLAIMHLPPCDGQAVGHHPHPGCELQLEQAASTLPYCSTEEIHRFGAPIVTSTILDVIPIFGSACASASRGFMHTAFPEPQVWSPEHSPKFSISIAMM